MRLQKIGVIRRKEDEKYMCRHQGSSNFLWTEDVSEANIVSKSRSVGIIRIDMGRDPEDYDWIEVVPRLP